MSSIEIINKQINEIIPYNKNPRKNEEAIKEVAKSIKEFGFKNPIIIDKNNIIICGHTRYEASKLLKLDNIPCIVVKELNSNQIKAFRIIDNKVSEYSRWDFEKLNNEVKKILNINMEEYGFLDNYEQYNELDITDDEFIQDTEITREIKEKEYICPNCGEKIK